MSCWMYIDTETTDLNRSEILQIGYFIANEHGIIKNHMEYFKIKNGCTIGALEVHGLSARKVNGLGTRYFEEFIEDFMYDLQYVTHLVGHNASFDLNSIKSYLHQPLNKILNSKQVECTMTDYLSIYSKTVCGESGVYDRAWVNLSELLSILVNRYGFGLDDIYSNFKRLTGRDPKLHDSSFDAYVTYLAHQNARKVLENAI